MNNSRVSSIKRAQKESLLAREIGSHLVRIIADRPELQGISVNRVRLSEDKGHCTVYFIAIGGKAEFDRVRDTLILFKPSIRSALAKTLTGRYVPELQFAYDEQYEKQQAIENLMDKLKSEGKL